MDALTHVGLAIISFEKIVSHAEVVEILQTSFI